MAITARGKGWEIKHSLWMLWFLSLGVFNGIAFIYIGKRTRQLRWIVWGTLYLLPAVLAVVVLAILDGKSNATLDNLGTLFMLGSMLVAVVAPIHAFMIRKEYLLRLDALEKQALGPQELKQRISQEYDPNAPKGKSAFKHDPKTGALVSCRKFGNSQALLHHGADARPMPDGETLAQFTRMILMHQIAVGQQKLDVADPPVALADVIAASEKEGLIEVVADDVGYHLTKEGQRRYDAWVDEAQELIKAYDIYGDADQDAQGHARFDTGLGKDLRVPVYESDDVDPFLARILLGINDGEWTDQPDWMKKIASEAWSREILAPVCQAPTPETIGGERLAGIKDQAKSRLRHGRLLEVSKR